MDDLVAPRQDRRRDLDAEGLGGLEVDDQVERGWLLDRKIDWLIPLEDPVHILGRLTPHSSDIEAVRQQCPGLRELGLRSNDRQSTIPGRVEKDCSMSPENAVFNDVQSLSVPSACSEMAAVISTGLRAGAPSTRSTTTFTRA
jgi:hypothetical protein